MLVRMDGYPEREAAGNDYERWELSPKRLSRRECLEALAFIATAGAIILGVVLL